MRKITTLGDLKGRLQAGFENNEESLEAFGKTYSTQLKAYLIESNQSIDVAGCPIGKWRGLDSTGWYGNQDENLSNTLFPDGTRERVWMICSIPDAGESDLAIKNWVESRKGLDRCWWGWGMCTSHYAQTLPIHKVGYKAKYKCGEADNGQGVDVFGNDMNKVIKVGVK